MWISEKIIEAITDSQKPGKITMEMDANEQWEARIESDNLEVCGESCPSPDEATASLYEALKTRV